MTVKRLFLTIVLCTLSLTGVRAQARYCMSYADYQEDKWVELDTLRLKDRLLGQRIKTENDSLDKVLKEEAFAILYHDTLLVNMAHMYFDGERFGNGYVPAGIYGNGQICFVNHRPGDNQRGLILVPVGGGLVGGLMAGAVAGVAGGAISSAAASKTPTYCFLVKREYKGGRKEARMIGDEYMKRYAESSPDFYAEYMSEKKQKKRERADRVLPLLQKWSMIR